METPAAVLIHNDILGLKGARAHLLAVSALGYYEVNLQFGERVHRVLLPIERTVVISSDPEENPGLAMEIER
ncbi:MAG: hypothetical protein U0X73_05070 [Thermoanaerobaculia bacterium]|jgi:hypothetical protein